MDLMWNIAGPVLVIYGDADQIMPPELREDLTGRLETWGVPYELKLYPGAGHAFSAPAEHMHDAIATADSWSAALAFLKQHMVAAA